MDTQPIIALLHGHGVDSTIWNRIDPSLSAEYAVVSPDLAHIATHCTIDEYAEIVAKHLRAEAGENGRVVLIGHSMGGYMALAFAEKYPQMVAGLVLFHSTAYADTDERKEQRRQTIASLNAEGSKPFIEKTLPKMVAPDFPAEQLNPYIDRYRKLPADALAAGMEAIMGRPDRTHVLRDAPFPVLLVLGKQDQLIPYDITAQLADLSGRISVTSIEQAGHLSMVEQPDEAARVLLDWLSGSVLQA